MNLLHIQPNNFLEPFEIAHRSVLVETEKMEETLSRLRFEGKASIGRNLEQLRSSIKFFYEELLKHLEAEERILFPFVASHVPKLESIIHLLVIEHDDFRRNFEDLKLFLATVAYEQTSESDRLRLLQRIQDTTIYLVFLIRNHVRVEHKSVYQIVNEELKFEEKKDLRAALTKFSEEINK